MENEPNRRPVFIITACIRTEAQKEVLLQCIESIRTHHDTPNIVILDDTPPEYYSLGFVPAWCKVERASFQKCGEVNAYAWSMVHKDEYSLFVYVHDSTVLLKALPLDLSGSILRPMWYAGRFISADTQGSHLLPILERFRFHREQGTFLSTLESLRRGHGGEVVFGGMAMWDKELCEKLESETNFLEVAGLFDTRQKRSFFERFIYAVAQTMRPFEQFRNISVCGDIFNHGYAFTLGTGVNIKNAGNPYMLKVWQGR